MLKHKILRLLLFVIVSMAFLNKTTFADNQNNKTNRNIIKTIVHEILDNSLKSLEPENLFYLQKNENKSEIFFENIILEYLKSKDKSVIFSESIYKAGSNGFFMDIKFNNIEINYKEAKNGMYERNLNIELYVKIVDIETKELKFIKNFKKSCNDLITKNMVVSQLNLKESFLKGTLIESRGLKKILEPALVIISSSIIVYLFYSIRSR